MEQPGRGRALRAIWSQSDAEVLAYMDVDLSTDLNALLPLVAPLLSGHSDLAIGTRLARGSRVIRGPKRELISRCYNLLLHACMGARFSDAQCGFKAIRREQARALLPLTQDTGWFFDTELLVLAERAGLRIHEIPVDWIDDLDSRVDIVATALADLRGMARLGSGLARGSIRVPRLRGVLAGRRPSFGRASAADREVRGRRHRLDDRVPRALPAAARRHAGPGRQRAQPAGDRGGQHGRQPAADVRDQRAAARGPAPGQGADRVRHRAGADLRRAGRPARIPAAASRSRSSSPPTWWPPSSGSSCTGPGSSASPGRATATDHLTGETELSATTSVARHSIPPARVPTRSRARRLLRGPEARSPLGAPGAARAAGAHGAALPVGPDQERLGQRLLRGGGPGRDQELEGLLLRLV